MKDPIMTPEEELHKLIEQWIIIDSKDPLYVKEAKLKARKDFKTAIQHLIDRASQEAIDKLTGLEHLFSAMPSGTGAVCTCGKEFSTTSLQNQHRQWHLDLATLTKQQSKEEI